MIKKMAVIRPAPHSIGESTCIGRGGGQKKNSESVIELRNNMPLSKETELKGVDSIYLALDGSKWWAWVNMVFIFL